MTITSTEDRKKVKDALIEISNSMARQESEKCLVREIVKDISDTFDIPKAQINRIARAYHKQNFKDEVSKHEEFEILYESIAQPVQNN